MTYYTEEEALAAARARAEDERFINFDGMNCNDYDDNGCIGWDGESRRCVCGNRRVSWSTYQNKDGTWYACAEAY